MQYKSFTIEQFSAGTVYSMILIQQFLPIHFYSRYMQRMSLRGEKLN